MHIICIYILLKLVLANANSPVKYFKFYAY